MSPNLMAANYMQTMQQRVGLGGVDLAKLWPTAGGILPALPVGLPSVGDNNTLLNAFLAANPIGTSTSAAKNDEGKKEKVETNTST